MDFQTRTQGHLLRIYMARADVRTAVDLAARLGVSRQTVGSWLSDTVPMPASAISSAADALDLEEPEIARLTLAAGKVGGAA